MEADVISLISNISSNQQLCQFLHNCIDELVGKMNTSHDEINNDVHWSKENYDAARNSIKIFFKNAAVQEQNIFDLSELSPEKVKCLEDCFEMRKSEILCYLQTEILAKLNKPVITDFDWKLKWIIGSSTLSSIREPLALMDLQSLLINQNETSRRSTKFEMNIAEVNNFITELENSLYKKS